MSAVSVSVNTPCGSVDFSVKKRYNNYMRSLFQRHIYSTVAAFVMFALTGVFVLQPAEAIPVNSFSEIMPCKKAFFSSEDLPLDCIAVSEIKKSSSLTMRPAHRTSMPQNIFFAGEGGLRSEFNARTKIAPVAIKKNKLQFASGELVKLRI